MAYNAGSVQPQVCGIVTSFSRCPKRQGRALKEPMGPPKKKEPQTELERLQAENLRLRAENALLKEGLSRGKEGPSILNGREPSTN